MKSKNKIVILVLIVAIIAAAFLVHMFSYRKLDSVLGFDYSKVDKILTSSGSSSKIVEITDKDEIAEYMNIFKDISVRRDINQLKTAGFCLEARFFIGNEEVGSIVYGYNRIIIYGTSDGTRYISNKNIDGKQIDEIEEKYNLLGN